MSILINHLLKLISWTELLTDNKLIQLLLLSLELRELEKTKMIFSGVTVKSTVLKTQLLLLKKSSELAVETQRKYRILQIDLMIRRNLFHHKTLRKVSKRFIKLLKLTEHPLTTLMESNIIHLIEKSCQLFLSFQLEELKKLVQKKDKKNGTFSLNFMETLGINLIILILNCQYIQHSFC